MGDTLDVTASWLVRAPPPRRHRINRETRTNRTVLKTWLHCLLKAALDPENVSTRLQAAACRVGHPVSPPLRTAPPVTFVPTRGLALKSPAVLNSSAKIVHASKLPDGATQKQGIAMLRDREFFLACNPHMQKFEAQGQVSEPELPEGLKPLGPTTLYNVTDIVETLPKGLWSSNVESTYEFTDIELGTFCALKSPMSVVMHTFWTIEEKDGGLELVEACEIKCSRLLIGIVKSLNEGGCEYLSTFPTTPLGGDLRIGPCPAALRENLPMGRHRDWSNLQRLHADD